VEGKQGGDNNVGLAKKGDGLKSTILHPFPLWIWLELSFFAFAVAVDHQFAP
jgi:hypothetical protein